VTACLVTTVTLGAGTACTSGGASTATPPRASGPVAASAAAEAPGGSGPVLALPARALASPGCSAATATGTVLGSADTATVPLEGSAQGVAATPDGRWAFAVSAGTASAVEVLRLGSGAAPAPAVTQIRSIPLPASSGAGVAGAAVTPDGKYLLVA